MTKIIGIYDGETDELITREMTKQESVDYELGVAAKAEREAAEAKVKSDKLAILAGLGITEEQAKVLGLILNEATPK